MDVDFQYTTAFILYGSNLDNLPFRPASGEDDAASVRSSINQTLNALNLVPEYAGQPEQNDYNIGVEEEQGLGFGAVAAWAAANYTTEEWVPCERELTEGCLATSRILPAADRYTYADLSKAVPGAQCDGGNPPPESSFTITPGITGSWYLLARDGEGYNIEIVGDTFDPWLLAYFYTYDAAGNQMWLVGSGPVNGDTAVVPVQVTSGALYGDAFDKDDVDREDWGTLTFTFSSCTAGSVVRESLPSMGFGTTTYDITRLTSVISLSCP
jgi:hypothetical protein